MYEEYDGNTPAIFADKNVITPDALKALKTDAPMIIQDIMDYKREIWNEFLTFMGISNLSEKRERMITGEVESTQDLLNLNLKEMLDCRIKMCEDIKKVFGVDLEVHSHLDMDEDGKVENEKEFEHKKNVKPAVSLSNKPIPKDKLNYSDLLEHALYENEKNQTNNNFKKILKDFMKKHDFSFERFVFPVHCMMKLATDGKKFNRYLDIEFFKHFLYQNGINIKTYDLIEFVQDNKRLYNDEKINIDYLKYIIEGDKYGMGVKESDFILFKQNFKRPEKPDRPEAAKIRQNKKKENKKDDNPFEESDSDSVKMIQREINGEDYI